MHRIFVGRAKQLQDEQMHLGQARDLHDFHLLFPLHQDQADALEALKQPTQRRVLGGLLELVRHGGSCLGQALANVVLRQSIGEQA